MFVPLVFPLSTQDFRHDSCKAPAMNLGSLWRVFRAVNIQRTPEQGLFS